MKLVRYLQSGDAVWGCVAGEFVHRLEGDPMSEPASGPRITSLASCELLAPCRPGKIVAFAMNFPGTGDNGEPTAEPLVFLKAGTSACGPHDNIVMPFADMRAWGEPELAVVIGRGGSIFGYTCANDVTMENILGRDHHLALSKSADTFCPLGPWIDTEYEPSSRCIEGIQNGILIRRGYTDARAWPESRAVEWLSSWMTLEPWDIILTGTPPRVAPRRYLQDGDEYLVRIDGLGELRNRYRNKVGP